MFCTDVDQNLYIFKHCGKTTTLKSSWTPILTSGITLWCASIYHKELDDKFNINSTVANSTRQALFK